MTTSTTSLYLRHREAVHDAEARRLARTLTSYGVLSRGRLLELSGARRWSKGRFAQVLTRAVDDGLVRYVGYGFYAAPRDDPAANNAARAD